MEYGCMIKCYEDFIVHMNMVNHVIMAYETYV